MSKKSAKGAKTAMDPSSGAAQEAQRLQDLAVDLGVLSRSRRIATTSLPPSKFMAKADGKDIVKRSSARRNRHLLVFNCRMAPAAAGRLGTLAQLDTNTPVMYVDFPGGGRLKLLGSLVFPRNKYMVLRVGTKEAVCEDVLESMIVFSEAHWVGTALENPEERPLPMPPALAAQRQHTKYEFGGRGTGAQGKQGARAGDGGRAEEEEEEEEEEDEDEDADEAGDEIIVSQSQRPVRRTAALQGGKRQRYAEDSDASFEEKDDEDVRMDGYSDSPPVRKLLQNSTKAAGGRKARGRSAPPSQPESAGLFSQNSSDEGRPLVARAGKQPKAVQPPLAPAAAGGSGYGWDSAAASEEEGYNEDEDVEIVDVVSSAEEEEAEEEQEEVPLSASQRPSRAAGAAAAKKLRIDSGSESEEEEEESESGGEEYMGEDSQSEG